MPWTPASEFVEEGVSFLLGQHENDEALKALVRVLLRPYERMEKAVPALRAAFDIAHITEPVIDDVVTSSGGDIFASDGDPVWITASSGMEDRLTRLGAIITERRNGRSDSEYLPFVRAGVVINSSKGEPSDLYKIARIMLGPSNTLRLERRPPAAYRMHVGGVSIAFPWDPTIPEGYVASVMADMLLEATGDGISLEVYFQTADDAHTFTFASVDAGEINVDQGFANDLGTEGGEFIGVETRQ